MNKTALIILLLLFAGLLVLYFYSEQKQPSIPPPTENGQVPTKPITQIEAQNGVSEFFANNPTIQKNIEDLEYVSATDWPPAVQVMSGEKYSCTEAGNEIERGGATSEENINGHDYCITKVSEGAAGSVYTQYAYKRDVRGTPIVATFTFQFPQCMNYDEPKQSECKAEQENFSVNEIIDSLFGQLMQK